MSSPQEAIDVWLQVYKRLTPDEAAAVDLCYGYGLTQRSIAKQLQKPLSTVNKLIKSAKHKLSDSPELRKIWEGSQEDAEVVKASSVQELS